MTAPMFLRSFAFILMASVSSHALAQDAEPANEPTTESDEVTDDHHDHGGAIEQIVVTASPLQRARFDALQSTAVLKDDQLEEQLGGTLGETLDHLPGVANASFGPGVGRPVIRGLGGDRIRVLVGGIGSIDASSTSPDHAVAVDPLTAQSIEVIRGPATLLYGNSAVGGVINILDGRIPYELPQETATGAVRTTFGTNANDVSLAATTTLRVGNHWAFNLSGSTREADDMEIPGYLRSANLRLAEPLDPGEEEERNIAENSSVDDGAFSLGGTYFWSGGYIGMAYSENQSNYGIPGGHAHEEGGGAAEEEEEAVRIDLNQQRFDLQSRLDRPLDWLERVNIRFGYGDYRHTELEGREVGTIFLNEGWEGRIELVPTRIGDFESAFGVQYRSRDFSALGDEAFVPPSETTLVGFFAMGEWLRGPWTLQGGIRVELADISAPTLTLSRDFTGLSLSAGVSRLITDDWLVGLTMHRTERAPNAEELFSNGPHLATNTFELGDVTLGLETATGGELSIRKRNGPVTGSLSVFYESFDNFIFERFTGATQDDLPVAQFSGTDAEFYGFEFEMVYEFMETEGWLGHITGGIDYVRATDTTGNTPIPRIPPLTFHAGVEFENSLTTLGVEMDIAKAQDRIAASELPTDGYVDVSMHATFFPFGAEEDISIMLQARNLLNEDIRYHTSFLKDVVPAAGRDFRLVLKFGF